MKRIQFILNRTKIDALLNPGMPALDFIRNEKDLKGTKTGCREGDCGACTILMGEYKEDSIYYKSAASCLLPLADLENKHIVTIEGINESGLNPIQQLIVEEGATQCGFCTPGFVISFLAFMINAKEFNIENAIRFMDGNICRCTGYMSIKRVAEKLCNKFGESLKNSNERIQTLIELNILPEYFIKIGENLKNLNNENRLSYAENESHTYEIQNSDPQNTFCAGGTDLYVQKADDMQEKKISFLSSKESLKKIWEDEKNIFIGSCATIEDLGNSNSLKLMFNEYIDLISSTIIRNRATPGGNIVNASPIGDLSVILLALDAEMKISNREKSRITFLKDFYKGYKNLDLAEDEIIEWFSFKKFRNENLFNFEKVSKRLHLDIASVNTAIQIITGNNIIHDIHISIGGVSPIPLYLSKTGAFLRSKTLNNRNIREASNILLQEISPISDVRGTKEYKTALAKRLFFTHFIKLFPEKFLLEKLYE